ncbi:SusC/RagA family TonB-linked outer membrane protein [Dysgonomonas macrotermitis]|uniref:TonB-linked outer membrane protein, SusC/RagA family n=1 Tax=Dysgonomonas macrotermitis TaxID=1346286 RepID=A0A1M4TG65_9BACT|nr:TonB-dependent receptor [Dysgonomonas macrotermitis]SHE43388.1 TonB-linked outer membrane protein, SusC/RagA family [Dysgonomonas macrotermitis]
MVKITNFFKRSHSSFSITRCIYIFLLLFVFPAAIYSQTTLRGYVFDEKTKEPVTGATIVEKSTTNGVSTGINGEFSLRVSKKAPVTLSVNLLGYRTQDVIVVTADEEINIYLSEDVNALDEVVVVGYGTQRRKELTGSVASVSKATLEQPATSINELLGGSIAGLNVTQTSGQPGGGSAIRIRGGNSIYASNEPLYVIDGFIFFSEKNATQAGVGGIDGSLDPLASINPSDIESIEVLKDVSAKAIYGSRGANGVILVTTKKGKRNGSTVRYQYTIGIDKSAKNLDLMTAKQWLAVQKEYFNDKPSQYYSQDELAQFGKGTDWQDAVLQTGVSQTHELSISGGDEKTRYLISGNYTDQKGIILNSGFERFSGRLNLDRDLLSNLTVGVTATVNRSKQDALTTFEGSNYNDSPYSHGIANSLTYALYMPPVLSIYNADGSYNYTNPFEYSYLSYYGQAANPVSDLKNSIGQTVSTSLLGNFYAQYTIIDGLKAKINAGANIDYITQNYFAPPYTALGLNQDIRGRGAIGNRRTDVTQTEYLLNYTKQLNPEHFIDLLGGYTYQKTTTNFSVAQANHLESFDNLASGEELPPISRKQNASFKSFLGRVNYTLFDRYNLTATYRADKSSRFAKGHEWGYFPSVGLSWNVNNETFLKPLAPALSTLKLRLTYGQAGNQEIDFDEYDQYFSVGRYNGAPAYDMTNLGNSDLKWETTTEYNVGIDAGFLNDRITLTADVYYKETRDLLLKVPAPLGSGTSEKQIVNLGNVTNKGFEFAVNARLVERKAFSWSASANIARNINRITDLGDYNGLTIGTDQEQILQVGEAVGSFYGYRFLGVVQTGEDVSSLPQIGGNTPKPGDAKYADVSGANGVPDGKVTPEYDRVVLGSVQPDFTYGFSSNIIYNKFDLYILFQGSQGNQVYNLLRRYLERPNDSYNMSAALLNSWTETNPSNSIPHLNSTRTTELDSRYVENASFLKLRNITLGYTLPVKINTSSVKIRFFASARNLFTITKYKGYDPEVASGIDLGVYPSSRSFMAGASITF